MGALGEDRAVEEWSSSLDHDIDDEEWHICVSVKAYGREVRGHVTIDESGYDSRRLWIDNKWISDASVGRLGDMIDNLLVERVRCVRDKKVRNLLDLIGGSVETDGLPTVVALLAREDWERYSDRIPPRMMNFEPAGGTDIDLGMDICGKLVFTISGQGDYEVIEGSEEWSSWSTPNQKFCRKD